MSIERVEPVFDSDFTEFIVRDKHEVAVLDVYSDDDGIPIGINTRMGHDTLWMTLKQAKDVVKAFQLAIQNVEGE